MKTYALIPYLRQVTIKTACVLFLSATGAFAQTFGPATESATDPAFLAGQTVVVVANTWTLTLPNFAISSFDSGTFSLSLPVSATAGNVITSSSFSFLGGFTSPGNANGNVMLTGLSPSSSQNQLFSFSTASFMGTLTLPLGSANAVLDLTINLDTTNGGTAGVRQISFTVQQMPGGSGGGGVPESGSTALLLFLGVAVTITVARFRRIALAKSALLVVGATLPFFFGSLNARAQSNDIRDTIRARITAVAKGTVNSELSTDMSPMGRLANVYSSWVRKGGSAKRIGNKLVYVSPDGVVANGVRLSGDGDEECDDDDCNNDPDITTSIPGGQAEYSIAVDSTGQHVVVGYNDTRGFNVTPNSLSGFVFSDDGGVTFSAGALLPNPAGTAVFGDPDIKYAGGSTFYYTSIFVNVSGFQTLCIHRSTDFGHTWAGPFEITSATHPRTATDSADKEFFDINPMGRILVAWSNFIGTGGAENDSTFSDDGGITWSPAAIIFPSSFNGGFCQGVQPRFNGTFVYAVTNARNAPPTDASGYPQNNEGFNVSTNNGVSWGIPANIVPAPFTMLDQILGNDRVHSFPFLGVQPLLSRPGDKQSRAVAPDGLGGGLYVVYATNAGHDGSDIAFQRSTDGGTTWSAAILLNSRPGSDRAQWFPTISVDRNSGRICVTYYDQGIAASGDLMEITANFSDNGGLTWSKPQPLSPAPFKAGWGNDTGQPNLGDYNQTITQNNELFSAHAITELKPYGDGEVPPGNANQASMTTPDFFFLRTTLTAVVPLRLTYFAFPASAGLGAVSFTESGGNGIIDTGDQVKMTIPLQNYVTNPVLAPASVTGVSATLSSSDPNITFQNATSSYPDIAPGATSNNAVPFVFKVGPGFVPGKNLPLTLTVTTAQGNKTLTYSQPTGSPVSSIIFSENFDSTAPGSLPAGWTPSHGGGTNTVPWTTSNTAFRPSGSPNNAAFHINANDATNPTRFERLFSPLIMVPASAEYVTLDMDVATNTEDDLLYSPLYPILAYDGLTLRITDQTPGRFLRSVLLEAFEEEFFTGTLQHFPKHLPRNNSTAYLQDLSSWAGVSGGFKHVHAKLPGTSLSSAGSGVSLAGATIQLRFEYTQDSGGTGTVVSGDQNRNVAGVAVDNIVVAAVTSQSVELAKLLLTPISGQPGKYNGVITSQAPAPAMGITASLSSSDAVNTTLPAMATIAAGQTVSPSFAVTLAPAGFGPVVVITATGPTNTRTAGILVHP